MMKKLMKQSLQACISAGVMGGVGVVGVVGLGHGAALAQESFPDASGSYLKSGYVVNPVNVRFVEQAAMLRGDKNVEKNMSKDTVRQELGNPHFSEGLVNYKEWNYLFNFFAPASSATADRVVVTCQFKIKFNDDARIESTHWKDAGCADFTK